MSSGWSAGEAFRRSPGAWILGALLVASVSFHYRTGSQFEAACVHAEAYAQSLPVGSISANYDLRALERICESRLAEPDPQE